MRTRSGLDRRAALRRVDLTSAPGEFIAIIGPSDFDKSTLRHILLSAGRHPTRPYAPCGLSGGRAAGSMTGTGGPGAAPTATG